MILKRMWELPIPSTSFVDNVIVERDRMDRLVHCLYKKDNAEKTTCLTIRFAAVLSDMYVCDYFTPVEMLGAYDAVVEVQESEWISQLRERNKKTFSFWNPKHYAIFMDGQGLHQFIAQGFNVHEEEE